jgi:hypothetical protein
MVETTIQGRMPDTRASFEIRPSTRGNGLQVKLLPKLSMERTGARLHSHRLEAAAAAVERSDCRLVRTPFEGKRTRAK